jgi:alkylation response protein AidB-like acyl-CoA dehydrogenase
MTTFHLWFDGLRVPEANRLGRGGEGGGGGERSAFAATQSGLNVARVHTAARAIGLARGRWRTR